MALYEISPQRINPLLHTTFAAAGVMERSDLQRLLRDQIEILCSDTLVIAEEFGEWEDSRRRIDLLGLDKEANLVVIELKRTEDGGHLELQALRYAAIVSAMTFDQAVDVYGGYLAHLGRSEDPRAAILHFLGWPEPDEETFGRDVRIVLASGEFTREITTTVIWLNERGLDIRCIRMRPYSYGGKVLLDVEQVIPLPEAAAYQVRVRQKTERERAARQASRDYTRFMVVWPEGSRGPLPKRRAILEVVGALLRVGSPIAEIAEILEKNHAWGVWVFRSADGQLDSDSFAEQMETDSRAGGRVFDRSRYFCADDELIRSDGRTYALTSQWGIGTVEAIHALLDAFPDAGTSCIPYDATL